MDQQHIAIGIVLCRGKALLAQRSANKHQGGKWEFPGGKVEVGETASQTVVRELAEEVGVVLTEDQAVCIGELAYQYPELALQFSLFVFNVEVQAALGREGQLIEWLEVELLESRAFPEANKPMIAILQRFLDHGECHAKSCL